MNHLDGRPSRTAGFLRGALGAGRSPKAADNRHPTSKNGEASCSLECTHHAAHLMNRSCLGLDQDLPWQLATQEKILLWQARGIHPARWIQHRLCPLSPPQPLCMLIANNLKNTLNMPASSKKASGCQKSKIISQQAATQPPHDAHPKKLHPIRSGCCSMSAISWK